MTTNGSSVAAEHIPWFITAPGQTDALMVVTIVLVILTVFAIGVVFFWLHSLPERLGHKKLQFEIVAVLGLISLFTHMHLFWIIGLLLALIDFPDFMTPMRSMARSLENLAHGKAPSFEAPKSHVVDEKAPERVG